MIPLAVFVLAALCTLAYGLTAWYLSAFWSVVATDTQSISLLSEYTIKPLIANSDYAMIHWQAAALISLLVTSFWGLGKLKQSGDSSQLCLPFACHLSWIVFSLLAHVVGGMASMVGVAYVLS